MSKNVRSVSVTAATHARLKARADQTGVAISWLVDEALGNTLVAPARPLDAAAIPPLGSRERQRLLDAEFLQRTTYEQDLARARLQIAAAAATPDAPRERPQFPPGSTCAICTDSCVGDLHREPLGRGGAPVNVCQRCETEPARERDHLFGGSGKGRNAGLGEGNRRTGNHI